MKNNNRNRGHDVDMLVEANPSKSIRTGTSKKAEKF